MTKPKLLANYIKDGELKAGQRILLANQKKFLVGHINDIFGETCHCLNEYLLEEVDELHDDITFEEIDNICEWNKVEFDGWDNTHPYTVNELCYPLSAKEKCSLAGYALLLEDDRRIIVGDINLNGGLCDYYSDIQTKVVKGMRRLR